MQLPPKKTVRREHVPGTARFLTFSCYRRLKLFRNDQIKNKFVETLFQASVENDMSVLAWVIMEEHVHLILYSEEDQMTAFLRHLKRTFSRAILDRWRELDAAILPRLRDLKGDTHFWQTGGGYDRNVYGDELLEKIRYVHRNPVDKGLAENTLSWKWSSAKRYAESDDAIGPEISFDLVPTSTDDLY